MVSPGRCYRRDTTDATHSPTFHQFEGLAVDKGLTLADLKGTLLHVIRALFGDERVSASGRTISRSPSRRWSPTCRAFCGGSGCRTCKYTGWIEMGGSGMVDPQVFRTSGSTRRVDGLRVRLGIERVALLRHGFPDLRALWENDLRVLRQF